MLKPFADLDITIDGQQQLLPADRQKPIQTGVDCRLAARRGCDGDSRCQTGLFQVWRQEKNAPVSGKVEALGVVESGVKGLAPAAGW